MTTCTPLKPFRCWQYHKGEPVPPWVTWGGRKRHDECWAVEDADYCTWYTPAEFAERFRVEGI
jgi:hypothetical protein